MKKTKISVYLPTKNVSPTIRETLDSLFMQTYQNFQLVIQDNGSTDNTEQIIKEYQNKYKNHQILFNKNHKDIGHLTYSAAKPHLTGEITVFMAGDDLLCSDAFAQIVAAFHKYPKIGAITRPYFWFTRDYKYPIRSKKQINPNRDTVLSIKSDFKQVSTMVSTIDQISGLSFRTNLLPDSCNPNAWTSIPHIFLSIFKYYPILMLHDYIVAVRISQYNDSRQKKTLNLSPIHAWITMINQLFVEKKYQPFKEKLITDFISINYIGLVQIKNFGSFFGLFREIFYLIKYNIKNIFSAKFWFFTFITVFTPRVVLLFITDFFKEKIYSQTIKNINFKYK